RFKQATARFDAHELAHVSARVVHALDFDAVSARLAAMGLGAVDRAFWEAVRANCQKLADVGTWWRVTRGAIAPIIDDATILSEAARLLPPEPWDGTVWQDWTGALALATGRKGKALFRPLRLALTGLDHGPDLKVLLPLIGRARALARLNGRGGEPTG